MLRPVVAPFLNKQANKHSTPKYNQYPEMEAKTGTHEP